MFEEEMELTRAMKGINVQLLLILRVTKHSLLPLGVGAIVGDIMTSGDLM